MANLDEKIDSVSPSESSIPWEEVPPASEEDYANFVGTESEGGEPHQLDIALSELPDGAPYLSMEQPVEGFGNSSPSDEAVIESQEGGREASSLEDAMSVETNSDVIDLINRVDELSQDDEGISRIWLMSELESLEADGKLSPGHPLLAYLNSREEEYLSLDEVLAYQLSKYFTAQQTGDGDVNERQLEKEADPFEDKRPLQQKRNSDTASSASGFLSGVDKVIAYLKENKATGTELRSNKAGFSEPPDIVEELAIPISDFVASINNISVDWQELRQVNDSAVQSRLVDQMKDDLSRVCSAAIAISSMSKEGIEDADVDRLRISLHALEDIRGQIGAESGLEQTLKDQIMTSLNEAVDAAQGICEMMNVAITKLVNDLSSTSSVER